jgi:nucleoside-diphosphate-sugar epimerase
MTNESRVAVVTGASGYLGSRICRTLEAKGWQVVRLTGSQPEVPGRVIRYELAAPITTEVSEALRSANVLIHAAYNLSITGPDDIWRVNVEGTRRLLQAAKEAATGRIIVLSSMSAFEGTSQLYGRAKLQIEAMTVEYDGCAIRPGLVYGEQAGGMAGALRKLTVLPIVPVISGGAGLFTVREDELLEAIDHLASVEVLEPGTISLAHPEKSTLAELLSSFAGQENRRSRFVPVPWQPVYWLLRIGEFLRVPLPFRADSLLGLVHTAPGLVGRKQLAELGLTMSAFKSGPAT